MAVPPTNNLEEKEQLGFFRKRVDYEKGNPDQVDPVALKVRVTGAGGGCSWWELVLPSAQRVALALP
jgi:hypothetical protein